MRRHVSKVKCNKPNAGWHKLSTDGSSQGNLGLVKGGVICDHRGLWMKEFTGFIGVTSSVNIEVWALRDGLLM